MANIRDFPGIEQYLDQTDDYENVATETNLNGIRLLIVTQTSELDGGQFVFRWDGEQWVTFDADTVVELSGTERSRLYTSPRMRCSKSSDEDHQSVHEFMVRQVDKFSSANGPDGGNLACVWAVRHIVYKKLNRWITHTDGTAIFDSELQQCYGSTSQEADTKAGGIIISPTTGSKIGHIGLLGPAGEGTDRLIYSNSSRFKVWKQNFTLETWIKRYRTNKHLRVRFYPLPLFE